MKEYGDLPIGIDLGTTFSCIGVYRNAAVEIIPNEIGDRITPSVVCFLDDEILVGEQTKYKTLKNPKNIVYAVKRIIGRDFDNEEVQKDIKELFTYKVINEKGMPKIEINYSNGKRDIYSPQEISAKVLAKLKQSAEAYLDREISKVVITVPAYFSQTQKEATIEAGKIAGLEVIKIINEPTAAALAYGFGKCQKNNNNNIDLFGKNIILDENQQYNNNKIEEEEDEENQNKIIEKETKKIFVFDLGGGTLDVTLLELEEDNISVNNHGGRMHLGGEDFDNILLNYCIEKFKKQTSIDLNEKDDLNKEKYIKEKIRLKQKCEMIKRELSEKYEAELEIELLAEGKDLNLKITRANFDNMCKDLFEECFKAIKEILKNEDEINKVDEIVLVGGSTRIPKIQEELKKFFNKNINIKLNPDEAVAYGATIEAAMEMGKFSEDITLLDVIPFSIGVASGRTNMFKYFEKGAKIPCKHTQVFEPHGAYAGIEIYEGENELVKFNYPLGKFVFQLDFTDLSYEEKKKDEYNFNNGRPLFDITFEINNDSILTVTCEQRYNKKKKIMVIENDKCKLSEKEIEKAREKQKNDNKPNTNLTEKMEKEKNYKYEIFNLVTKIKDSKNNSEKIKNLLELKNIIEKFIDTFTKKVDSFWKDNNNTESIMYYEKMYFYLNYLFTAYSNLLLFEAGVDDKKEGKGKTTYPNGDTYERDFKKETIIKNIKKYLGIFSNKHTSYCPSLVNIFVNNDNELYAELFIQILGYYSERGTHYLDEKNKNIRNAKNCFEECLLIINKYNIREKVENLNELKENLKGIENNCKESINKIKAEKILEKYPKFNLCELIKREDFGDIDEIIDILDKFQEALKLLEKPEACVVEADPAAAKSEKQLKAVYLANIMKIEFKIFKSNKYKDLLKMLETIEKCIELKLEVPKGCNTSDPWFKEICDIKLEIEKEIEKIKEDPIKEENKIKEEIKEELDKIDEEFKKIFKKNEIIYQPDKIIKEKIIDFVFFIMTKHKPRGLKEEFNFKNKEEFIMIYNSKTEKLMKELRKRYHPQRYKGDKEEQRKQYCIMENIATKLNIIENTPKNNFI